MSNLRFADDTILFAESVEKLKDILEKPERQKERWNEVEAIISLQKVGTSSSQ